MPQAGIQMSTSPANPQYLRVQVGSDEGKLIMLEPSCEYGWKYVDLCVKYGTTQAEVHMKGSSVNH